MGMIEIEIEFNELRKRNIVRFDRNDDWHPYLLVNTDRAYFDLNGNKISVLSRDFSLCRDLAQVKREQNFWSRIHRKKEYADQRKSTGFFLNGAVRLIAIGTPSKFPKRNSLRNLKEEIGGER